VAIEVKADEFEEKVLKADKPVLVDFFAAWCGPCVQQTPILEKWAGMHTDEVTVMKLDIDQAQAQTLATQYGVMSIPTLILFKDGEEVERVIGLQNEKGLDSLLAKAGG